MSVFLRKSFVDLSFTFEPRNFDFKSETIPSLAIKALSKSFSPVLCLKSKPNCSLNLEGTATLTHHMLFLLNKYFLSMIFLNYSMCTFCSSVFIDYILKNRFKSTDF